MDGSDIAAARDNFANFANKATITNPYDYNRDRFVDGSDMAIARDNATNFLTALKLITAPTLSMSFANSDSAGSDLGSSSLAMAAPTTMGVSASPNDSVAGPIIDVGSYKLAPNTPGQTITLSVSGDSQVTGFNLRAELGDGLGPNPEPIFQAVGFSGGIWDAFSTTVAGGVVGAHHQYAQASVVFNATGESVAASGNFVTLTLDTTGLYGGTYALDLADTDIGADSVFIGNGGSDLPATITNGSVTIITPPPAITSAASTTFTVGKAGSFTVTTMGYPTATLTETGTLPRGVAFVNNGNGTATLSGTPAATTGDYVFDVTADNPDFPPISQTFTLAVTDPPIITSATGDHLHGGQGREVHDYDHPRISGDDHAQREREAAQRRHLQGRQQWHGHPQRHARRGQRRRVQSHDHGRQRRVERDDAGVHAHGGPDACRSPAPPAPPSRRSAGQLHGEDHGLSGGDVHLGGRFAQLVYMVNTQQRHHHHERHAHGDRRLHLHRQRRQQHLVGRSPEVHANGGPDARHHQRHHYHLHGGPSRQLRDHDHAGSSGDDHAQRERETARRRQLQARQQRYGHP